MRYVLMAVLLAVVPRADAGIISDHVANGFDSRYDIYSGGFQTPNPVLNASPSFIGQQFNFSGVGYSANSVAGSPLSVTMISPSFFVGAWHVAASGFHFNPGQSVVFVSRPPAGSPTLRTFQVATITRLTTTTPNDSDVLVGRLTTAVQPSDNISTYPIAFNPSNAAYTNQPLLVYGQNPAYGVGNTVHVGTNRIDQLTTATFSPPPPTIDPSPTFAFVYDYNAAIPGEIILIPNDSGSPSFIPVGNQIGIVGAHFGNGPTQSVDSFLPFYLPQITAIVTAGGESVSILNVPVPEPSSLLLVGAASAAIWWRRRAKP